MAPQPPSRPIPDNAYSRRLLEGGRGALDQIRNERRYYGTDLVGNNPVSATTGYPSAKQYAANTSTSDLFDQWLAQVTPGTYQQTVGRGDGKYAGYQTQGMMEAATRGLANQYQQQGRAQFDALNQLAGQRIDDTTSAYDTAFKGSNQGAADEAGMGKAYASVDNIQLALDNPNLDAMSMYYARLNAAQPVIRAKQNPQDWSVDSVTDPNGRTVTSVVPRVGADPANMPSPDEMMASAREADFVLRSAQAMPGMRANRNQYLAESLTPWYEQQAVPYMAQQLALQDMADQGRYAPYSVYGQQAAATLGIAPEIAAYWFTPEGDMEAANEQRAADIYAATGQTPEQYQAALDEMMKFGDAQTAQEEEDYQSALEGGIVGKTGFDAGALAASSDLPLDYLYSVVNSEAFDTAIADAEAAISADDIGALEKVVTDVSLDPANDPLLRVLLAMYNDRLPNDLLG